jgi:hypothetical protein
VAYPANDVFAGCASLLQRHHFCDARLALWNEPRGDADYAALRQPIRNRVSQEALGMVEATIGVVHGGQYATLKYLFAAVGLFSADIQNETQQQDVLAPTLLPALGLPEVPVSDNTVTKDSAQS